MISKDEIEKRLKGVPRKLCVAFAARTAMRVLPFLAEREKWYESFWYWGKDKRAIFLLSIFIAQRACVSYSTLGGKRRMYSEIVDAVKATVDAKSTSYIYLYAAATADAEYYDDYYHNAANVAVHSVTNAADSIQNIVEKLILEDLKAVKECSKAPLEIFQFPLWPSGRIPVKLQPMWKRFCRWSKELDAGFEIWIDWHLDRVAGKPLDLDLLRRQVNLPNEILEQGPKAVNAYLATLEKGGQLKPLKIVRAIFIGNGAAGKTSLIRALNEEKIIEGKEDMTPGIEIRSWDVADADMTARFWDFGGQVMAHATHQFFLRERCLYIVVLDARSEFNANDQAEYWLEHVKAFGKNAPVMLVGNKSDLTQVNLDMRALKENYSNIVGFYPVSCVIQANKYKGLFESFQSDLIEQLRIVGENQISFTDNQFAALKELRRRSSKSAFLRHSEFNKLCDENEVGGDGELSRKDFLGVLDKLGEVIHFPQITHLDSYVLNPRWLTYGVYTLIYSEEAGKARGELNEADVVEILGSEKVEDEDEFNNVLDYPPEKCSFIIDAMEAFKLCYRLPEDHSRFVMPDKLPAEQPDLDFDKALNGTLISEFVFLGFLPRHVMPTLIVMRHQEIVDRMVWQNGIVLYNKTHKTKSCIQVDYHKRTLTLWIQGDGAGEMLVILNDEVEQILMRMEALEYTQLIALPVSARIGEGRFSGEIEKISCQRLLATAHAGETVIISDLGQKYDLNKILGSIMTKEMREKEKVGDHYEFHGPVDGFVRNVEGNVTFNQVKLVETAGALDNRLEELFDKIMEHSSDAKGKKAACKEVAEMQSMLKDINKAGPEQRNKLSSMLEKAKSGTLGFLSFAKKVKDNEKTVEWIVKSATTLLGLLG